MITKEDRATAETIRGIAEDLINRNAFAIRDLGEYIRDGYITDYQHFAEMFILPKGLELRAIMQDENGHIFDAAPYCSQWEAFYNAASYKVKCIGFKVEEQEAK